jgi:hypothetical protein
MEFTVNYGVVNVCLTMYALRHGMTVYHLNKFDKADFMLHLLTWKVCKIINSSSCCINETWILAQLLDAVPIHWYLVRTQF